MKKIFTLVSAFALVASAFAGAPDLTIKKIAAPAIDGDLTDDGWAGVASVKVGVEKGKAVEAGFKAEFKMAYDNENLYFGIKVTDATANQDGTATWQSDCVELFLAMDTNAAAAYRPGDWQIRKKCSIAAPEAIDGSGNVAANVSSFTFAQVDGSDYVQEWKLPFAVLKETAAFDNEYFRMDIQVADNDGTGAERTSQLFWHSGNDDQWSKVASQGLVKVETKISASNVKANTARAYVAGNQIRVSNVNGMVNVYDVTGKLVLKAMVNGSANMNASMLRSGIYIVSNNESNLTSKVVIK